MRSDRRPEGAASAARGRERRNRRQRRPRLEGLESRRLLTSINDGFSLPSGSGPEGITVGSDNNLWFTQVVSSMGTAYGQVGVINPNTGQLGTPIIVGRNPEAITSVPGAALWFTEAGLPPGLTNTNTSAIGTINPATRAYQDYFTPTVNSVPTGIVYDSANGNVYFTESAGARIGVFHPATITSSQGITEIPLPSAVFGANARPSGITYDPNDGNIWFTLQGSNQIGMFNPSTQTFNTTPFSLPNAGSGPVPTAITVGPDKKLWFLESGTTQIGSFDPSNLGNPFAGPFSLPAFRADVLQGIVAGPDGNIWFTAGGSGPPNTGSQIGMFSPASPQSIQLINTPNQSGNPYGITVGPDHNIWFTEFNGASSGPARGNGAIGVVPLTSTPTPTTPTPTPTTPTPTPTTPTIIGERVVLTSLKHSKKGKPIGKPVVNFVFQFSTAMNPGTAGNSNDYQVAWVSTKKVKKKVVTVLHPIGVSATYSPSTTSVTLATSSTQKTFAKGGQITLMVTPLAGRSVFTILPKASGLS